MKYLVGHLTYSNSETKQNISVIQGLSKPLLGLPAIEALSIVSVVEPIMIVDSIAQKFPKLFQCLGSSKIITYQVSAKLWAVYIDYVKASSYPLLPKAELQRMLQLGVIEKVEQPTEWCSGVVVVPKAT